MIYKILIWENRDSFLNCYVFKNSVQMNDAFHGFVGHGFVGHFAAFKLNGIIVLAQELETDKPLWGIRIG